MLHRSCEVESQEVGATYQLCQKPVSLPYICLVWMALHLQHLWAESVGQSYPDLWEGKMQYFSNRSFVKDCMCSPDQNGLRPRFPSPTYVGHRQMPWYLGQRDRWSPRPLPAQDPATLAFTDSNVNTWTASICPFNQFFQWNADLK